jgi:hypothetical protein
LKPTNASEKRATDLRRIADCMTSDSKFPFDVTTSAFRFIGNLDKYVTGSLQSNGNYIDSAHQNASTTCAHG